MNELEDGMRIAKNCETDSENVSSKKPDNWVICELAEERSSLINRTKWLERFIASKPDVKFSQLSLINEQLVYMKSYADVLGRRIKDLIG
jgi:hypothetical protein